MTCGTRSALLTDLYELTMAQGYWATGRAELEAVFQLFFRRAPFGGGFAIAAGLDAALAHLEELRFGPDDLAYLAGLVGGDGSPLFQPGFLDYLRTFRPALDIDGVPEGTVVFAHEPLLRVRGPMLAAQLVESALLNAINFPTLVATKAARIVLAAGGAPVVEFGLRRAQGPDGGLTASRAAYIGGCVGTSNVLAGKCYGIPVRGTHAHSWVLSFETELEAFEAYGRVMPNNVILLVDTYDTASGVDNAIAAGRKLREAGHELEGIRLDSGDLAYLSREARAKLDAAGFRETKIMASNDLDEETIESLRLQRAAIDGWGVGTRLVTAYGQPALGGVYKLAAIRAGDGRWRHVIKVSEQPDKTTIPGLLRARRYYDEAGVAAGDSIYDELTQAAEPTVIVDPTNPHRRKHLLDEWQTEELLVPAMRSGERLAPGPPVDAISDHARASLARFDPAILRRVNPHAYPAGIEATLHARRERLIETAIAESRQAQIADD
jgi:nicotinate phosphoribosyltransferase